MLAYYERLKMHQPLSLPLLGESDPSLHMETYQTNSTMSYKLRLLKRSQQAVLSVISKKRGNKKKVCSARLTVLSVTDFFTLWWCKKF